jgi:hypothetical protein
MRGHNPKTILIIAVVVLAAAWIVRRGGISEGELWGPPVKVPMLAPFEGVWSYDQDRTFNAWRAQGVSEDQIAKAREAEALEAKTFADVAQQMRAQGLDPGRFGNADGKTRPNLEINGHVLSGIVLPGDECRLYELHQHGATVCGKAWHHEDPGDPGDMSKCYVQLSMVGEELRVRFRMQDGLPDLEDPDLRGDPAIVAAPGNECHADAPLGRDWDEWSTCIFLRPAGSGRGQHD